MTDYVTLRDVERIVTRYGWCTLDPGLLDQALYRPRSAFGGVELYPGLHPKGAALLDSVNRLRPLIDGNKRLSWVLVATFYALNGHLIEATDDDAEAFVLQVAGRHLPVEEIASWFASHTERRGGTTTPPR